MLGSYLAWIVQESKTKLFGMKLPTAFELIGQQTYVTVFERVTSRLPSPPSRHALPVLPAATLSRVLHEREVVCWNPNLAGA